VRHDVGIGHHVCGCHCLKRTLPGRLSRGLLPLSASAPTSPYAPTATDRRRARPVPRRRLPLCKKIQHCGSLSLSVS
jgi:hypothetical protein